MNKSNFALLILCVFTLSTLHAQEGVQTITIENSKISGAITIDRDGELIEDSFAAKSVWSNEYDRRSFGAVTDAGFRIRIMWSAWSAPGKDMWSKSVAPGKAANADNLIDLTQRDFKVVDHEIHQPDAGGQRLVLRLVGRQAPLEVRITYELGADLFYARRNLAVRVPIPETPDNYTGTHYLASMWPVEADLKTKSFIIKEGGFGQPIALSPDSDPETGFFWGMEFPTAQNTLIKDGATLKLEIGDYYGAHLSSQWTSSDWVVIGLSPQINIRQWFMRYVDDIRAQPVRPFLNYNTWYDLQAPDNVDVPERVLNEQNVLNTIEAIRTELTEKRGIALDGFVLDDGWDFQQSDWTIAKELFPNDFGSIVDALSDTDTDLGIWFSPIGGYSNSNPWRLDLMAQQGYERIGGHQLCIAGSNYHRLLKERIKSFTQHYGVSYYKWDGIQFSCNNPAHGHPIGVYSRRSIMESVIELGQTVWDQNRDGFLNITSGTWLSPWWVKYANTIWMQGGDYGFTNVPSISLRDRAITFRDLVLYDNFRTKDLWFPISNLMTVGIIKGKLHQLSEEEKLSRFADNAVLAYARGVSMWSLYVSPEIITPDQWDVLAQGAKWAKHRFDILKHTVMVGGDPGKGEAYGYAHFKGDRGVLVVRNPIMEKQSIDISLNAALGVSDEAASMVVEQVYPRRHISRALASFGSDLSVDLQGYETAIYEIFPLKVSDRPLLAGAIFESEKTSAGYRIKILDIPESDGGAQFLNPELIRKLEIEGREIAPRGIVLSASPMQSIVSQARINQSEGKGISILESDLVMHESVQNAELSFLLQSDSTRGEDTKESPEVSIEIDGRLEKIASQELQGSWGWYSVSLPSGSGKRRIRVQLSPKEKSGLWTGSASLWITGDVTVKPKTLDISGSGYEVPPFPPTVYPENTIRRQQKLGKFSIDL